MTAMSRGLVDVDRGSLGIILISPILAVTPRIDGDQDGKMSPRDPISTSTRSRDSAVMVSVSFPSKADNASVRDGPSRLGAFALPAGVEDGGGWRIAKS